MTDVKVTPLSPGAFGVEIEEGDITTGHRVHMTDQFLDDMNLLTVDPVLVVHEAIAVVLDQQPATAIPEEVSMDTLAAEVKGFSGELVRRIG